MINLIYKKCCPGCGQEIDSLRLSKGLLCKKCMPNENLDPCKINSNFKNFCHLKEIEKKFIEHFKKTLNSPPRELQLAWARRFFLKKSFAMLAPTGIGKSTFGLILASFLLPKKSYLIFPTSILCKQAYKKLQQMGFSATFYSSDLLAKEKKEIKEKIFKGNFEILITTTNFLYKNFESIPKDFEFVFIDDVDSILKSAKNIDKVLMLLGFSKKDINLALKFIDLKQKMALKKSFNQELLQEWQQKINKLKNKTKATLIVSSATANPKSKRVHLFRELLGFEVGRSTIFLRNIEDIYDTPTNLENDAIKYIKEFKKGGLIFLPGDKTKEELKEFVKVLNSNNIKAKSYEEFNEEEFRSGKIDVIVGFASYKNPLARGLDMPEVIRYALFVGVPKMKLSLELNSPISLYFFLLTLQKILKDKIDSSFIDFLNKIRYKKELSLDEKAKLQEIFTTTLNLLDQDTINQINNLPDISLEYENGFKLIIADVTGYIQASGRVSRLYAGGLTKGLSFLLIDNQKAFLNLEKKLKLFSDIEFKPKDSINLKEIFKQIDEDRAKVVSFFKGSIKDLFKTTLVIVESPNKARTIASFYGKPVIRDIEGVKVFEVANEDRILSIAASKGHIFDLATQGGFYGVLKNSHFIEIFEPIDEQREKIIEALRELDIENSEIFIATDPDTEGEKISYDIYLNLLPYNKNISRIEFHEVTKRAFNSALKNSRSCDENLVKAQLLRRVADRWIGFELSSYLQKKFNKKTLSAGRVQSAVLEWIVLREREAREKIYVVKIKLLDFEVEFKFNTKSEAREFFNKAQKAEVKLIKTTQKSIIKTPFSTDKMLSTASIELSFSPQLTMQLAQDLFEAGFITYHRTDSIRVSDIGVKIAKEYIISHFNKELFKPRSFEQSGGAHEAIRPTKALDAKELEELLHFQNRNDITKKHLLLYDLIFKTFIASQIKEAIVKEDIAAIKINNYFAQISFFSEIIQDGINLIMPLQLKTLNEGVYPINKELTTSSKVPRFTYAQIISLMKTKGVGRPSTYAITLEKLLLRKYIYQKGNTIFATNLGIKIYNELKQNRAMYSFINEHYTKELEESMDKVERGEVELDTILNSLYKKILKEIHKLIPS